MADRASRSRLIAAAVRAARSHATPFYLFDRARAVESLRAWRPRGSGDIDVDAFYPWKCNRHPALLALAANEGWGAEVTAREDLASAISSGSPVLFQGPAKEGPSIDAALRAGAWLVADGPEDALAILDRARALALAPRYLLRLRPAAAEPSQRRFGIEPAGILALARRIVREKRPGAEGLAFHLGTGLASSAPYLSAIREAGVLGRELAARGVPVRILDVGGGFAARGERRLDARGRARGEPPAPREIVRTLRQAARRALPGSRLFLEPGRAVASDAFHLVTRVVRVTPKRIHVDASRMSHAWFVPRGRHEFWPAPLRGRGRKLQIAGPLPVDLDVFSEAAAIGRPREGDLIVIGSVGAYNLIAANAWAGAVPEVVEVPVSA